MTDELPDLALTRALEAILFAAEAPLTLTELTRHVGERGDLLPALRALSVSYEPRGINLVERGGRWQFQTAPDLGHYLRDSRETVKKLSRAGVETLAVIAYHEPVTRPEIEAIRGVAVSGGTIDVLMEAGWVRPAGRRETPGRPLQYATTPEFLAHFNLASRRDLPGLADLKAAGLLDREPPRELPLPLGGEGS
jgi:segregation and condensation protein B